MPALLPMQVVAFIGIGVYLGCRQLIDTRMAARAALTLTFAGVVLAQ